MMKIRCLFWLGVFSISFGFPRAGVPQVSAAAEPGLYLQETETYSIYMMDNKITTIHGDHLLGVGENTSREKRFNVTLVDHLPGTVQSELKPSGTLEVKALDGNSLKIPYTVKSQGKLTEIKFQLTGVPTVDLSKKSDQKGSCCGCDGSCGIGCGVEFHYGLKSGIAADDFASVKYQVNPKTLKPGVENIVAIDLTVESKFLKQFDLALMLPAQDNRALFGLVTVPPEFTQKQIRDIITASKTVMPRKQSWHFEISVNPKVCQPLVLKELFRITGRTSSIKFPEATPMNWKVLQRTNATVVNFYLGVNLPNGR